VPTITLALSAMATRFEIVLHGERPSALRAAAEEAFEEIEQLEAQLSQFRSGSEIAHLNARAAKEPVRVTPRLFALLQHCRMLYDETGGAFDITVAPLLRCWGFRDGSGHLPDPKALADARGKITPSALRAKACCLISARLVKGTQLSGRLKSCARPA
jgi:thiamine biosynthesis lipoprotein